MVERRSNPETPTRKHLLSGAQLARATDGSMRGADLTRHHGQGNGLRVNGIYFGVISLVAIVGLLIIIAMAGASEMM